MKELDLSQIEQLKNIGAYLAQVRQEKAMSLEEIAVKTYIPLRLLQALEQGQVERLPEPVFVQGFIRRYADMLGLDGQSVSKTFTSGSPSETNQQTPGVAATVAPRVERQAEPATLEPQAAPEQPQPSRSAPPVAAIASLALGVLLLSGGILWAATNLMKRPQVASDANKAAPTNSQTQTSVESTASPQPPGSSQVASPETTTAPLAQTNPTPAVNQTGATAPIQVAINLSAESWLQVTADGKTEFEGTLKKGEQRTWTAKKSLTIQSGNAGAVSISYNQGDAKVLGELGEVKDISFPPQTPTATN